ncbi:MAG: ASKHA domain-containing protein, partial [Armatimonadota bacterium]
MASIEVTIQPDDIHIATEPGDLLLDIALKTGVPVLSECGGQGECGSCRVEVQSGLIRRLNRDGAEEEITSPKIVLACQTEALGDVVMRIPDESRLASAGASVAGYIHPVAAEFVGPPRRGFPLAERRWVELEPPSFDDPTCDWERLVTDLQEGDFEGREFTATLRVLRDLPTVMRENDFHVVATLADCGCHHEVIDITAPAPKDALGLVVDLGTSNVKAELVDLATGRILADGTAVNAQTRFGEDVISRIIYTQEHEDGADRLQEAIVSTVNGLIDSFLASTGKRAEDIIAVSCDGNATMISLRFKIPPDTIRRAPHIAPTCRPPIVPGEDLDLNTHPKASVFCAPAINGYVGGDISAGILATGLFEAEDLTLLIDVGTNGEIVLGNRDWLTCCSCSAGPAFEGMGIQCGLPARPGAIDSVEYD